MDAVAMRGKKTLWHAQKESAQPLHQTPKSLALVDFTISRSAKGEYGSS